MCEKLEGKPPGYIKSDFSGTFVDRIFGFKEFRQKSAGIRNLFLEMYDPSEIWLFFFFFLLLFV